MRIQPLNLYINSNKYLNNTISNCINPNGKNQKNLYGNDVCTFKGKEEEYKRVNLDIASLYNDIYRRKDLGLSKEKREIFNQLLELRDKEGNLYIEPEDELEDLKDEKFTDEMAQKILKKGVVKDCKTVPLMKLISSFPDDRFNEITYYSSILNSMYENNFEDMKDYGAGKTDINTLLDKYSNTRFENSFYCQYKNVLSEYKKRLYGSDSDASYFDMFYQLERAKMISSTLFVDQKNSVLSRNIRKDIDKCYEAWMKGESLKDKFVPEFKDEEEARKSLEVGDVCRIKDEDYIRIKLKNNSMKEIFLTADEYLNLFPPVDRFNTKQRNSNDCVFLAITNALYENPNSRYRLLEMFCGNNGGPIMMASKGFKREGDRVVLKDGDDYVEYNVVHDNLLNKIKASACKGIKALEIYFEKSSENDADEKTQDDYIEYKTMLDCFKYENMKDRKSITWTDGFEYTKEELEILTKLIEDCWAHSDSESVNLINCSKKSYLFNNIKNNEPKNRKKSIKNFLRISKLLKLADENDKEYQYAKLYLLFMNRYEKYMKRNFDRNVLIKDVLPVDFFKMIDEGKLKLDENIIYTAVNNAPSVLDKMGLKYRITEFNRFNNTINDDDNNLLLSDYLEENCIMVASRRYDNYDDGDIRIIGAHQYSVTPVKENGKRMFIIRDPRIMSQEMKVDFIDLFRIFHDVIIIGI